MDEFHFTINPNHFKSIEIQFKSIKNNTTSTEVKDLSHVLLVEFFDKAVTLELPSKSCSLGHNLGIIMIATVPGQENAPLSFPFTSKVESIERDTSGDSDASMKAYLSFIQFEEKAWEDFRRIFSSRQEEINEFLKAARG